MRKIARIRGTILFLAVCTGILSMSWESYAVDLPTLLKKVKARYLKFQRAVKDMVIVQETKTVTFQGEMITETKLMQKGKKLRWEMTIHMPPGAQMPEGMGPMRSVVIYDGQNTWMIAPFVGKKKLQPSEERKYKTTQFWWEEVSKKAKIVGTEQVQKRSCYVIATEGEESPFTRIWVDKKRLTLVKVEMKEPQVGKMVMILSDFRKIKKTDWEIPYKTEVYHGDQLISVSVVKSVKINKGLPDDLFDPDKVSTKGPDLRKMMKKMIEPKKF